MTFPDVVPVKRIAAESNIFPASTSLMDGWPVYENTAMNVPFW